MIKVYLTYYSHPAEFHLKKFRELADRAKNSILVESPELADLIFVTNVEFDDIHKLFNHFYLKKYPEKCFVISLHDRPKYFFRGIYASPDISQFSFSKKVSTSYTSWSDTFGNRFIQSKNENLRERKYFFSFMGRISAPVRGKILNSTFLRKDIYIEDTTESYKTFSDDRDDSFQEKYYRVLTASKFAICPRGWGTNSGRLFEAMKMGVAPVIISDNWLLPIGPDWDKFSIRILEKDVDNLEEILKPYESRYLEMGKEALLAYHKFFVDEMYFDYLCELALNISKSQFIPEKYLFSLNKLNYHISEWIKTRKIIMKQELKKQIINRFKKPGGK